MSAVDAADILRRAEAALAAHQPGVRLQRLEPLTGGTSSLTYTARAQVGDAWQRVVVKVAPPGLPPVRNRDVLRQARVLTALARVPAVAVPEVLATETGDPPDVPPLFVMSYVDGESYEPRLSFGDERPPAADVHARARAAATMLAALHAVSPAELGLDEPVTSAADEVHRWRRAINTCDLDDQQRRVGDACYTGLMASIPPARSPALLHGDWRLGNMQCRGGSVLAVIDWEIWSIGDGRTDLAWLRLMADETHPAAVAPHAPMLTPDELLRIYEGAAGAAVPDIAWFDALARYKQAAAHALIVKNADKRGDASPHVLRMRAGLAALLTSAAQLV
jgi:aminoglycoside phosphotransferase (APT) family kinase protein